mgnify:CR=1 FL=1
MGRYIKGLFKDTSHIDQLEGSWRYAKNINIHPTTSALSNESGNEAVKTIVDNIDQFVSDGGLNYNILPPASIIVGAIEISDNRIILFIVYDRDVPALSILIPESEGGDTSDTFQEIYGTNADPIYNGEIGLYDKDVYTTLYRPNIQASNTDITSDFGQNPIATRLDLNFNKKHFIEGTYKINPEGELFVYWTDDLNPPRAFNVTRQERWLGEGSIPTPTDFLYGIDPIASPNLHHREILNLFPSAGPIPKVDLHDIKAGGGLLTGVYYIALAYVDQDLVQTNYLVIANPVSIVEDVEGVLPIERYDGANPKTPSGKAIAWEVTNVNTDYAYVRPAIVRHMDGQRQVFRLNDIPVANLIRQGRNLISFTGLEDYANLSVSDIIIDVASYESAKTINQLDGILYLGNVQGSKDLGYQKYANFIKAHPVTKVFPNFDPREYSLDVLENGYIETSPFGDPTTVSQGYRHAENIFKYKGYQRDEVYAFYIAFILNDGTESYAYHIPGREQLRIQDKSDGNTLGQVPAYYYGFGSSWNQQDGSTTGSTIQNLFYWNNMCGNGTFSQCMETQDVQADNVFNMSDGGGRMFHFYETSLITSEEDPLNKGARNMNFWQNSTEFYPADDINGSNWEIWDASLQGLAQQSTIEYGVGSAGGANGFSNTGYITNTLKGQRIRHHHFPSNENIYFKTILGTSKDMTINVVPYKREWYSLEFAWCSNQSFQAGIGLGNSDSIQQGIECGPNGGLGGYTVEVDGDEGSSVEEFNYTDNDADGFDDATGDEIQYPYGAPPTADLIAMGYDPANYTYLDSPDSYASEWLSSIGAGPGEDFFMFSRFGPYRNGSMSADGSVPPSWEIPEPGTLIEVVWVAHRGYQGNYSFVNSPGESVSPDNERYRKMAGTYDPATVYGSDIAELDLKIDCFGFNPCPKHGDIYMQGGNNSFGIQRPIDCTGGDEHTNDPDTSTGGCSDNQAGGSWYFGIGCVRKPGWVPTGVPPLPYITGYGCTSAYTSLPLRKYRNDQPDFFIWPIGTPFRDEDCTDKRAVEVVWANENFVIVHRTKRSASGGAVNTNMPDISSNPITGAVNSSSMVGWIAWAKGHNELRGVISHEIQALGIQFEDIKVPPDVWEKTQGFRIYYAKREHEDKRVLGQNLVNPYAPSWDSVFPGCASQATLGSSTFSGNIPDGQNINRMWINWPYSIPSYAYPSIRYWNDVGTAKKEYQAFGMHDFHLMRTKRTLAASTHIKVEYSVEMFPITGPGLVQNCWYEDISGDDCGTITNDETNPQFGMQLGSHPGSSGDCVPIPPGATDCTSLCLEDPIVNSMLIGMHYYSPTQTGMTSGNGGGTNGLAMYNWLVGTDGPFNRYSDLNRVLKERCKTYLRGDSIYNGRQLGFGFKTYNDFGESHASFLLHENSTLRAFEPEVSFGTAEDPTYPAFTQIAEPDVFFQAVDLDASGDPKPVYYLSNLHAFRLDMYNSIDTQKLVWTGYEVTGAEYKRFWVDEDGAPVISASEGNALLSNTINPDTMVPAVIDDETGEVLEEATGGDPYQYVDLGDGVKGGGSRNTENGDVVTRFKTAHVFGGDTFICRHGYRKHLRPNLNPVEHVVGVPFLGHDIRMLYDIIVESTDNINFRHMEARDTSYYPGSPAKDVLDLDNTIDLTGTGKIKYNEDYSAVNDLGHTVPLPLQIAQPSNFPTRVIRSTKSDDTTLIDAFRVFLVTDFKDLPKNRGDLWKISVFNNLLYLHMQDTLYKTQGKQTMQLGDGSEAFVGSGNIFAQDPVELVQTESGHGGLQSQWSTCVTKYGYFYVDQKNRRVFMATDSITDIGILGLEKWFSTNLAYELEYFGKRNFEDNPLYFSFISVWDEEFQRVILTKREIAPTNTFSNAWRAWQSGTVDPTHGAIKYEPTDDSFYWSETGEEDTWELLTIGLEDSSINTLYNKDPFFQETGWSVSYYPKLNIWVSFHDYWPYRYLTTSTDLYSLKAYALTGDTEDIDYSNQDNFFHRLIWRHNIPYNKGKFYTKGIEDHELGTHTQRNYDSECEVIHNQGANLSKMFYNFSFITDVYQHKPASFTNESDFLDNLMSTKIDTPGITSFILYNTYQCSGQIQVEELVNTRRNGKEWYINKFRDFTKGQFTSVSGGGNTSLYYDLFFYDDGNAITPGGVPTPASVSFDNSRTIITTSGADEQIMGVNFDTPNPKKFVDKYLAIRLIISNSANNLVNLYSTEVGVRKFLRK